VFEKSEITNTLEFKRSTRKGIAGIIIAKFWILKNIVIAKIMSTVSPSEAKGK